MKNEQLIPSISQRDYDTAQELSEQGVSAEEVQKVVAGDSKEIAVDNIILPVKSIGAVGTLAALGGNLVERRPMHEWAQNEKNPRA